MSDALGNSAKFGVAFKTKKTEFNQFLGIQDIMQSNIITTASSHFTVPEKRILYRIMQQIQNQLKEEISGSSDDSIMKVNRKYFLPAGFREMPLSLFLKNGSRSDYDRVIKAFKSLNKQEIKESFFHGKKKYWRFFSFIEGLVVYPGKGRVTFNIPINVYDKLLDMSLGYTRYKFDVAFNFKSSYTMRYYEMFANCKNNFMSFEIDTLKEMFMLNDKYSLVGHFISRVVQIPQKELEDSDAPIYFTFQSVKKGRKIVKINFFIHDRVKKVNNLDISSDFYFFGEMFFR